MGQGEIPAIGQTVITTSQKVLGGIFLGFCVLTAVFHIYIAGIGAISATPQRALHLMLMLIAIFLCKGGTQRPAWRWVIDITFTLLVLGITLYYLAAWRYRTAYATFAGFIIPAPQEIIMGIIMIFLIMEATRRTTGMVLVIVVSCFLLYAFVGPFLPGFLGHQGYSLNRIVGFLYLTQEGIFGPPIGISANFVILFVIFGAILDATGGGKVFIDIAYSLTGRFRGGSGKTTVVASALVGLLSGSPVANVVTTGPFTIPLMKRSGFPGHVAAAIEASASTGGMILPPILGAAAFLMAENLGISYASIAHAALIPAVLYFFCIFYMTDVTAIKYRILGQPASELPRAKQVFIKGWHLILPLVFLVFMIVRGFSVSLSAFWAILLALVVSHINWKNRPGIMKIFKAMQSGVMGATTVASACASAGILLGIINITGIGVRLSRIIIAYSNDSLLIAGLLTMVISMILGLGLPVVAVYMIVAVLCAPALIGLGATELSAHMFVFYFGIMSNLTPPVALAAYAAAGIAGSPLQKTAITSFKMAIVTFLVPFFFLFSPLFLSQGPLPLVIFNFILAVIGLFIINSAIMGYFKMHPLFIVERVLLLVGGFLVMQPVFILALPGLALSVFIFWIYFRRGKKVEENMNLEVKNESKDT